MLECLKGIFLKDVAWVNVAVDPPMVYRHLGDKPGAVTRPGIIYISMTCDEFWKGPEWFVLHEYYHVVEQWANGMTVFSYLLSWQEKENEAQRFGIANHGKLKQCMHCER
jgi:hypothetical protein